MNKGDILILQNPANVAGNICKQLQSIGYNIVGVLESISSLKAALELARPQLVIIAINPRKGIEIVQQVHVVLQSVRVPVIFVTEHADASLFKMVEACDATGFIINPIQDYQLEGHINLALRKFEMEERLRESERQFRILAEQSPNIVLRIDRDSRCIYANPKIIDLIGQPPEFIIGKYCHEVGLPESVSHALQMIVQQTIANRAGIEQEFQFTVKGGVKILHIRTAPEFEDGVGVRSIIATARDVTLQRGHERRIEELAQRLLYHLNNSPLAIIEWDSHGKCLSCNDEMEMLTGWSRMEIQEQLTDRLALIHPEDRDKFEQIQSRLRNGSEMSAFTIARTMHRTGATLICEWYLSSMLDDSGQSQSILCFISDVTSRENAERELVEAKNQLEASVLKRTAELRQKNDELLKEIEIRHELERELIKISEREHRRIGQDLHDGICQELAGIRFSLEAITKRMSSNSPYKPTLSNLTDAVARAIQHTRLLSRGLAPLDLERGNLCHALREFAENSAELFQIECHYDFHGEHHKTFEMEQATNLFRIAQEALQNAMKHAEADRVNIRLDLSSNLGELSITDNGKGLPLHNDGEAKPSGMGLKIMNQRANMINGQLRFERPEFGGTRIVCTFPH